jgi:glycerol-3-phosphate dehydrogenase (NAD(P)+)
MPLHIATVGDGAMATVSSLILAGKSTPQNPISVGIWGHDPVLFDAMNAARENTHYLPGIKLPDNVRFVADPALLFQDVALILCAVPTQYIRDALERLKSYAPDGVPVVSVAKGIEVASLKRPSEIIAEILGPRPIAALSGPSIAAELARHLPCTMVVAAGGPTPTSPPPSESRCSNPNTFARWIQELFTTSYLRVYRNDDLLGVELAGALKNVIAVAAGILDGMQLGNNAKAALLTRGLVEITRLGLALGAQPETFAGLAGLGDLVTTCVSPEGRNRTFGQRVGHGEKPADVLASMLGVVEGVPTCESVVRLARDLGIDMPIAQSLHGVLFEDRDPRSQLADLMARELKAETQ